MITPPHGPHNYDPDLRELRLPDYNTPQPIFSDEHDGVVQLRKQDNKLSLELDPEQLEVAAAVLSWVKITGLQPAEAEQAIDILERKIMEVGK